MRHVCKVPAILFVAAVACACTEHGADSADDGTGASSSAVQPGDGRTRTSGNKQLCRTTNEQNVEQSELLSNGYTAQQVLDVVLGERVGPVTWLQSHAFGPESGSGSLRLSVSRAVSPLRYSKRERVSELVSAELCKDELTMPVEVRLSSEGGALDEVFTASAIAVDGASAQVTHVIKKHELGGDFARLGDAEGGQLTLLEVRLTFTPSATKVELHANVEKPVSVDVVSSERVQVAGSTLPHAP